MRGLSLVLVLLALDDDYQVPGFLGNGLFLTSTRPDTLALTRVSENEDLRRFRFVVRSLVVFRVWYLPLRVGVTLCWHSCSPFISALSSSAPVCCSGRSRLGTSHHLAYPDWMRMREVRSTVSALPYHIVVGGEVRWI